MPYTCVLRSGAGNSPTNLWRRAQRVHDLKKEVRDFWNEASCGERLLLDAADKSGYLAQMGKRYSLEPFIESFARFNSASGHDVLEIGVGLGADHQRYAQAGARLTGIDLTDRAVEQTRRRFELFGLKSDLRVADAESLPFGDGTFDLVYSWGVLHHSSDTPKAVSEVLRVLRPPGRGAALRRGAARCGFAEVALRLAKQIGNMFSND